MISAEEARKRTHEYIENYIVDEELREIEKGINLAIEEGEYSFTYRRTLHQGTEEKLKELGYTIGGVYTHIISWIRKDDK